ncbi:M14 family metallopeptidase [Idiomarina xiamenensis]|uniref:Deacylase/carboxypeptidase superfamily protein n=1 Tax=Idiomarina xiamenensis 10-D-4 TaxID=740709 RepID=K2JUF0_9GAMM|nr:M14 family metallocarboxypeptidase [Idiomarina xiamenensis]EKE87061.1 deacylase/carboxypeptidase superfamily protein [Idiomarina xiamenensis 10-D-4]
MTTQPYPIGTPGQPWTMQEKQQWLAMQSLKRSYFDDVVDIIDSLKDEFNVEQYGELNYAANDYPLFALKTRDWQDDKPVVLVTGGVHGYETSGVHGALRFLQTRAKDYERSFNIVVAPCISPWGYETINRWNPAAVDPNRSFVPDSPAPEAKAIMKYVADLGLEPLVHIDLHETTDTDNSEFRPALAARDGVTHDNWNIPDGFYLACNSESPEPAFQQAILEEVAEVTHIAPADSQQQLIGVPLVIDGVIGLPVRKLGLCIGFTQAAYTSTTEVYPDSDKTDAKECVDAQVAAVTGGLDYLLNR